MVPFDDAVQRNYPGNPLDTAASIYPFEGRAAQAVKRLKYSRATALADPMSKILLDFYVRLSLTEIDLVVPVPIHWSRMCSRGFNQSALLCEAFPLLSTEPGALKRIRPTRPQVGLTRQQRLTNLKGAFRADPLVNGSRILLVDDVMTSGGTATACAEALRQAGSSFVAILTFCGEREPHASGVSRP